MAWTMPIVHSREVRQAPIIPSSGHIRITGGGTADGDRISINGRIYEFDTGAAIGGGAHVRVDVSGGANPAQSIAALVAAINADTSRVVDAMDIGGDVCGLVARTAGALTYALVYQSAGGTIAGSSAVDGGAAESRLSLQAIEYEFDAADVATLLVAPGASEIVLTAFASTTRPRLFSAVGRAASVGGALIDPATGILTFRQANANYWALCYAEPVGGALFAAGNVLAVTIGVSGV